MMTMAMELDRKPPLCAFPQAPSQRFTTRSNDKIAANILTTMPLYCEINHTTKRVAESAIFVTTMFCAIKKIGAPIFYMPPLPPTFK